MNERVSYIEIDLPVCSLTYGQSPCAAAIGVTGDHKCFNTRKTCQDTANYYEKVETIRFAEPTLAIDPGIIAIPNISSVSYTPSRLALGESIGARSVLNVTFFDHPFPDTGPGGDPYRDDRSYIPYHQGTFWGKFRARQPWLRGRELRWYTGTANQTIGGMEKRTFVIDAVSGPDSSGRVTIKAKDPLTLIDDKRAQAPRLSNGTISNTGGISDSATSLTLQPTGIGNAEYPASGHVAIGGNEIVSFTRSGDVLTITRGQFNTETQEHDEDDRVQLCLEYSGEDPGDIIYDLITEYSNVPASFISLENWNSETSEFLGRVYTALIAEPTPVKDLVNEILEQAGLTVWWDEIGERVELQVLRNVSAGAFVYDDNFMLAGSFQQSDNSGKRVSQVWTYYGQINPLERQNDPKNYRNTLATVSIESETNHGSPAYKTIYSRWMPQFSFSNAERLNELILARYAEPPKTFRFGLLRDSGVPTPSLADGTRVESFILQDAFGDPVITPAQIVQLNSMVARWEVMAEELTAGALDIDDPTTKIVPIAFPGLNFNFRDTYNNIYSEAQSGDTVICEVRAGVIVGSATASQYAWRTGTGWPAGVTLKLRILAGAYIVGKGGDGGSAFVDSNNNTYSSSPGQNGGPGILIETAIEIVNDGIIGGGGGGGGGVALPSSQVTYAIGGGGGAGSEKGTGGQATNLSGFSGTTEEGGEARSRSFSGGGTFNSWTTNITGGAGGDLAQSGTNANIFTLGPGPVAPFGAAKPGGSPGNAVNGDSLATWTTLGDIRGNRVG